MQFKTVALAAILGLVVNVQADNWCKIASGEAYVNCRKSPNTSSDVERRVYPDDRFGVSCKKEAQSVFGDATWDYVPGWRCWISAYYTRSATSGIATCETGISTCPSTMSARFAALF